MTTEPPLAHYSAFNGAFANGFAIAQLHHLWGHNLPPHNIGLAGSPQKALTLLLIGKVGTGFIAVVGSSHLCRFNYRFRWLLRPTPRLQAPD